MNLANHNSIFLVQTIIYQINCIIGIYEWWRSSQKIHKIIKENL
ncbi:hypothetical protein [Suttonella indologenes]|nr:hypothetical protein [Suttonella indologenes]